MRTQLMASRKAAYSDCIHMKILLLSVDGSEKPTLVGGMVPYPFQLPNLESHVTLFVVAAVPGSAAPGLEKAPRFLWPVASVCPDLLANSEAIADGLPKVCATGAGAGTATGAATAATPRCGQSLWV